MSITRFNFSHTTRNICIAAVTALAFSACSPSAASPLDAPSPATDSAAKPTIVLVHGAWADASSFKPVTVELQKDGYQVLNAPNPLRGLASDSANVAAFVNQNTTGPVVLVGHSYGGSVISNAALSTPTVTSLVYIDAFAPDTGESALQLTAAKPGSDLAVPDPSTVLNFVTYPGAPEGDVDAYVKPAVFLKAFGLHLPEADADALAASQTPIALSALAEPSGAPAWKSLKSFFYIGTEDAVIPAAEQTYMANRAHGVIATGSADHLSMLEKPTPITHLIEQAATTK
nr:alpha/beta hydrolase [Rhodococcus sp. (in: high G+C Gram-positive bacteria)]